MKINISILLFLLFSSILDAQITTDYNLSEFNIDHGWKLRKKGDTTWIENVDFPNSIHMILFQKNLIPDPYFGNNEEKLKWIEESDWEAELEFDFGFIPDNIKNEIYFGSLEPFTKVFLNGKLILESSNAFIDYKVDITGHLKDTIKNLLRVEMPSPVKMAKELQAKNSIFLPYDERVFTRKPQYEFGWDWGPRFVKSGGKLPAYILSHNLNYKEITNIEIHKKSFSEEKSELEFQFDLFSFKATTVIIRIDESFKKQKVARIKLKKGINKITLPVQINFPKLWWPHGSGDPNLYQFRIVVKDKKNSITYCDFEKPYAFCDIKLVKEKDQYGESFYFTVNGKKTYLKGFNVIPLDHFYTDYSKYSRNKVGKLEYNNHFFENLEATNANTIRIWGGGVYPSDDFLLMCLANGIIVWQDFMFAGGMYPGDTTFMKNVEEEVTSQVRRLRDYNNIALYCGNNEIDEAWHNWGWQKQYQYSKEDSTKIWNDYIKIFHELIPSIVKKYDSETDYIPSSPEIGWGRKESLTQGDSHYWGIWWGKEPIETFEENVPRFMSEFGMQSMPYLSTLRKVIPDSLINFNSPEFKNHQKHPTGFETLNHYLEKYLTVPSNMEDYIFATQLLQTITLETAINSQRVSEKCMGSLIWQLNDTWPVISWSVIDSDGNKKLAVNTINHLFASRTILREETKESYLYYYINDNIDKNSTSEITFSVENINDTLKLIDTTMEVQNDLPKKLIYKLDKSKIDSIKNQVYSYTSIDHRGYYPHFYSVLNKIDWIKPEINVKILGSMFGQNSDRKEFYRIYVNSNQTLFYPYLTEGNYLTSAGKHLLLFLPVEDFDSKQSAIDYVKNNLKSLNHLLGK